MKTIFILSALVVSTFASAGETNRVAGTNAFSVDALLARAEFINKYHPLRVYGGELYDWTEYFVMRNREGSQDAEIAYSKYHIRGKVLQVLDDGLLIKQDSSDLIVFLKNYIKEDAMVDGFTISVLAVVNGRYQYVATSGGKSTIISYDWGRAFDAAKDNQTTKKIIRPNGTAKEFPVTGWDAPFAAK